MSDIKCPYCKYIYYYDGDSFAQNDKREEECPECGKFFMVTGCYEIETRNHCRRKMKNNLPIEEQVITQPQAEELAEIFRKAGVKPPGSLWAWNQYLVNGELITRPVLNKLVGRFIKDKNFEFIDSWNAYNGVELGVLLPRWINAAPPAYLVEPIFYDNETIAYYLTIESDNLKFECSYKEKHGYPVCSLEWPSK